MLCPRKRSTRWSAQALRSASRTSSVTGAEKSMPCISAPKAAPVGMTRSDASVFTRCVERELCSPVVDRMIGSSISVWILCSGPSTVKRANTSAYGRHRRQHLAAVGLEVVVIRGAMQTVTHAFDDICILRVHILQVHVRTEFPDQPARDFEPVGSRAAFNDEPLGADTAHQSMQGISTLPDGERHVALFHDNEISPGIEVPFRHLHRVFGVERPVGKLLSKLGENLQTCRE